MMVDKRESLDGSVVFGVFCFSLNLQRALDEVLLSRLLILRTSIAQIRTYAPTQLFN